MLDSIKIFNWNNYLGVIIGLIIIYFIIKTIYNFNKPIDINNIVNIKKKITKSKNIIPQTKLQPSDIYSIMLYYFGII